MTSEQAAGDDMVEAYTDGACLGNPGPGGWGVLLRWRGAEREISGGEPDTTNNRMELMAAIQALEALTRPVGVCVHTDSRYVRDGITEWIHNWKQSGWRTSRRKSVKNDDLWRRLDEALQRHRVEWRWVRGHAGHPDNERADRIARDAAQSAAQNPDSGKPAQEKN